MIQRGKCPMCGGTMTEDSTHTLLVCDFCGNKEPLNYPVQNQTPNQGQYTNSSLQTPNILMVIIQFKVQILMVDKLLKVARI